MKYIIIHGDGMADWACDELGVGVLGEAVDVEGRRNRRQLAPPPDHYS